MRASGKERIRSPRRALEGGIYGQPGGAAFGLGGVVRIDRRFAGGDDKDDAPPRQRLPRIFFGQDARLQVGLFRKRGETRVGARTFRHSHW